MHQSKLFYKTLKKTPKEAEIISHQLLLRAGYISQLASGVYNFLPLGFKVHKKIEDIIRDEMNKIKAQEVLLASFQPKEIWQKTDRWDHMDPPLFKVKDRHKKEFTLGPTHEEVITDLVKSGIESYKDLPFSLFQIQTKFRNEMRFTGGLLRAREFIMKDLYSFHQDEKDLSSFFDKVLKAYANIYNRCGLNVLKSEASGGVFTKEKTYEFQVLSDVGEDKLIYCPKCKWAINLEVAKISAGQRCLECNGKLIKADSIEVGHTFKLGTKYSKAFNLYFIDKGGRKKLVSMGCYGIGLGRLMATVTQINNDKDGIIWPEEVAPYKVHLIQIEDKVKKEAEKVYKVLQEKGIEVLYDDRKDKSAGEKFAEADLIGIPYRIVISNKTLEKDSAEVKKRGKHKVDLIKIKKLPGLYDK